MTRATVRHDGIKQLFAEMRKPFDGNGPFRVAMDALIPDQLDTAAPAATAIADGGER